MATNNQTENQTTTPVEIFSVGFCHLIDFKTNTNGTDCSPTDPTSCILCPIRGTYITGESINDYGSIALKYYYPAWILVVIVSLVGLINNLLILMVIKRRKNWNSFDVFLVVLAGFDAFSSILTISASTSCVAFFGNWFGRGRFTMYWYSLSLFSALYGRSGSTFTTVLITIERFLIITFPYKANSWFTSRNTKIIAFVGFLISSILNFPRFLGYSVEYNDQQDIPSIKDMEWVLKATAIGKYSYGKLRGLHNQIDFWTPLPIIALFNLMSLYKVHQISKKRKEVNASMKREIRATKMFLPVVIVYFLTNICPIVNYVIIQFTRKAIREVFQLLFLSIALNSAANLPIYYWSSSIFKTELKELIRAMYSRTNIYLKGNDNKDKTTTTLSVSSASNI